MNSRKIGIIGAMAEEIEIIKGMLENVQESINTGITYYHGQMHNKKVVLVKSGIGKVNAAIVTQHLINNLGATVIINIGLAGALEKGLDIGDAIVSNDVVYHDVDATGFGYPIGQVPGLGTTAFTADPILVKIASGYANTKIGRIATGDQFVGDSEQKQQIHARFNAMCAEMEGAAISHVCYLHKIPFVVIRTISDKAEGGAFDEFNKNLKKAVTAYVGIVEKIVKEVPDDL